MSKLNPQNATAYVGPGVLRKGGKITPVPNGPLIKKKGPFKGSTLKVGGTIKKAQNGDTLTVKKPMTYAEKRAAQEIVKQKNREARENVLNRNAAAKGMTREQVQAQQVADKKKPDAVKDDLTDCSKRTKKTGSCVTGETGGGQSTKDNKRNGGPVKKAKAGAMIKRAQNGESFTKDGKEYTYTKQVTRPEGKRTYQGKSTDQSMAKKIADYKIRNNPSDSLRTVKPVVKKNGGMIKRADGSMSKRGLWDNIRANKGSGKKPTKQMLVQEKKIKAKSKK